jgi:hypothetical protein
MVNYDVKIGGDIVKLTEDANWSIGHILVYGGLSTTPLNNPPAAWQPVMHRNC